MDLISANAFVIPCLTRNDNSDRLFCRVLYVLLMTVSLALYRMACMC